MKKTPVVILGGMGDGLVTLEILHRMELTGAPYTPAGFLNDALPKGTLIAGQPVLGKLEEWQTLQDSALFIPALHKVKDMHARIARIMELHIPSERWACAIDPHAVLARDVTPGPGSCVGSYAVIQPGASIGAFASIRAGASLGHDSQIGDFAYIGPNAVLCGGAHVQRAAHVGPGAVLNNNIVLGEFSILGSLSAALHDIPEYSVAMGNPARVIEQLARG